MLGFLVLVVTLVGGDLIMPDVGFAHSPRDQPSDSCWIAPDIISFHEVDVSRAVLDASVVFVNNSHDDPQGFTCGDGFAGWRWRFSDNCTLYLIFHRVNTAREYSTTCFDEAAGHYVGLNVGFGDTVADIRPHPAVSVVCYGLSDVYHLNFRYSKNRFAICRSAGDVKLLNVFQCEVQPRSVGVESVHVSLVRFAVCNPDESQADNPSGGTDYGSRSSYAGPYGGHFLGYQIALLTLIFAGSFVCIDHAVWEARAGKLRAALSLCLIGLLGIAGGAGAGIYLTFVGAFDT